MHLIEKDYRETLLREIRRNKNKDDRLLQKLKTQIGLLIIAIYEFAASELSSMLATKFDIKNKFEIY